VTNEGEVYFALFGDVFDPNEVTQLVGLEPTSTRRKAIPIPKHTWWKISIGRTEGELVDVYEMSSALVEKLTPHTQGILRAKQELKLEAILEVVLHISMNDSISTPAIGFTPEVVSFLSAVGASIDIDTYRNAL
jgi:hypothetical protein